MKRRIAKKHLKRLIKWQIFYNQTLILHDYLIRAKGLLLYTDIPFFAKGLTKKVGTRLRNEAIKECVRINCKYDLWNSPGPARKILPLEALTRVDLGDPMVSFTTVAMWPAAKPTDNI